MPMCVTALSKREVSDRVKYTHVNSKGYVIERDRVVMTAVSRPVLPPDLRAEVEVDSVYCIGRKTNSVQSHEVQGKPSDRFAAVVQEYLRIKRERPS